MSIAVPSETPIADMVERMISTGIPPDMIVLAVRTAEQFARDSMPTDATAERRRAYDRERKAKKRNSTGPAAEPALTLTSLLSDSNSQEGIQESKKEVVTRARRKVGITIPENWQPNEKHEKEAVGLGRDRAWMLDCATDMRLWAGSKAPVPVKISWDLTFSGWMRRAVKSNGARASPQQVSPMSLKDRKQQEHDDALNKLREHNRRENQPDAGGGNVMRFFPANGRK